MRESSTRVWGEGRRRGRRGMDREQGREGAGEGGLHRQHTYTHTAAMLTASRSIALARARTPLARNVLNKQQHHFSFKRFNSTQQQSGDAPKKAKPFSLTGFIFKLSLLTAAVYGTAATAALIYEPLQEPYLEYFPYGEEVMDKIDYTWKHRAEIKKEIQDFDYEKYYDTKYAQLASSINETAAKVGLDDYINIPHKGIESIPVTESTKKEITAAEKKDKDEKFLVLSNSDVEAKPKKTPLPLISVVSDDPMINNVISSLNHLITEFNNERTNENSAKIIIDQITNSLNSVSDVFNSKDVKEIAAEKLSSIKQQFEQEKTILVSNLAKTAEQTKSELEAKHKEILAKEVEEIKKSLELEYENKLKRKEADLIDVFDQTVTSRIEEERNNKLKDLDLLADRINDIEKFELELSKVATSYTTFKEVRKSISKVRELLNSNISSNVRGENLVSEIKNLKELTKPLNNELINATLDSLPSNKELLLNGGVLTQSQILTRWELLAPELRSVSLLPENPGILGYASSMLFSKFLWSKSGVPIKSDDEALGNDVESVIARVNNFLQKNQLDDAVEEVTHLKGVARELANDWLVDTRRKLEIQFLVDLLSTEVNISA